MRILPIVAAVSALVLAGAARAGAWGVGPFDNDDALDFAAELVEQPSTALVYRTLEQVNGAPYVEAPLGSAVIAAAEVVAALRGHASLQLPPKLAAWVKARREAPSDAQLALAAAALRRVADAPDSELRGLWRDAGDAQARRWEAGIQDVLRRLGVSGRKAGGSREP